MDPANRRASSTMSVPWRSIIALVLVLVATIIVALLVRPREEHAEKAQAGTQR